MKRILILGAADAQVPLIVKSKELGYYVICVDRTTTNPGLVYVDKHYKLDYMDTSAVLSVAEKEKIDGVISNSEAVMYNVAYVSKKLSLRGNTCESIRNLGEKNLFRDLQKRAGVFTPAHCDVCSADEAVQVIKQMKLPVIMKPCRNSASRGIIKIDKADSEFIKNSFSISKANSWNGKVTVEEFVEMPKLSIIEGDIFVYDGKILWDGIFNDQRSSMAPMVPMTDSSPLNLSLQRQDIMRNTVTKIIEEAGIEFGQFNVEMYFTSDDKLFVIEINTRQGGIGVPLFIEQYSGIDFTKLLVSLSVNDYSYCNIIDECRYSSFKYLVRHSVFCRYDGIYKGLYFSKEILHYVNNIEENKKIGDNVSVCVDGTDAIARVDFIFPTYEVQQKFLLDIEKYVYPLLN